jgi:hypothetical protein
VSDNTVERALTVGDYAVYKDLPGDQIIFLKVGQLVVINRSMNNLIEVTIKRVASCENDALKLTTHAKSGNLYRLDTVPLTNGRPADPDIKLVGLVVGSYRPII